jgi:hypothetical protein
MNLSSSSSSSSAGLDTLDTFLSNSRMSLSGGGDIRGGGGNDGSRALIRKSSSTAAAAAASTTAADNNNRNNNIQELYDRIHYLETKLNAYLAYTSDPFLSTKSPITCKNNKFIKDIACPQNEQCSLDNQVQNEIISNLDFFLSNFLTFFSFSFFLFVIR